MTKAILAVVVVQLVVLVAIVVTLRSGVTVANQVEPVAPVEQPETVTVEVPGLVQVGLPADGQLFGYCFVRGTPDKHIGIRVLSGGRLYTVAEGVYDNAMASAIGLYVSQYYNDGQDLTFGSQACSRLDGWR